MPRIILKATPDQDFYVEWSTIVEAPVFAGIRERMLEHLREDNPDIQSNPIAKAEARLRRADETGTSAAGPYSWFGAWDEDDNGLIVEQRGVLPRHRLYLFTRFWLYGSGSREFALDLLEPFEDLDEVRRD